MDPEEPKQVTWGCQLYTLQLAQQKLLGTKISTVPGKKSENKMKSFCRRNILKRKH